MNRLIDFIKSKFIKSPSPRPTQERYVFTVTPEEVYVDTIREIREYVRSNINPPSTALQDLFLVARKVVHWDLGVADRNLLKPEEREERRLILELARLWYTEKLHASIDHKPMLLHITKDDRWRL